MIKRASLYLLTAILGTALGVSSALYLSGLWPGAKPLDFGDVEIDGWRSDFAIGSETADPYTRARVARHGLLALAKSEAVYFTKTTDSEGRPLTSDCDYRVVGGEMPADWWSITLYNSESYLPDNDDGVLSVDATNIGQPANDWEFAISAGPPHPKDYAQDWISSRNAGQFDLTLRLYMPDAALLEAPERTLVPPSIDRVQCIGEAS